MVNYCCVYSCGRNSRTSKHLYFYSVPKDINRQEQWLKAARREDLFEKPQAQRIRYRFCSRHFSPQSIKNKHLCTDAVPTLYLPGCEVEEGSDDDAQQLAHSNIACNNCRAKIVGFRYKCVSCPDFDLCSRCEMAEAHEEHLMLRIPSPIKFKKVENMVKKWQQFYNEETSDNIANYSSDDEPIQKYAKNYDSGIDLSDDIKQTICTEVARVMKLKITDTENKKKKVTKLPVQPQKRNSEVDKNPKKQKTNSIDLSPFTNAPEVAFADVNEDHSVGTSSQVMDVKTEHPSLKNKSASEPEPELPMMNIKLSDDLSELMMEVSDQKSIFKF